MSALIFVKAEKLSALISFVHEKWVGLNILGESALIFLALATGPLTPFKTMGKIHFSQIEVVGKKLWTNVTLVIPQVKCYEDNQHWLYRNLKKIGPLEYTGPRIYNIDILQKNQLFLKNLIFLIKYVYSGCHLMLCYHIWEDRAKST